ncbi:hypothetical protein NDU88_006242 [Pleurodeles waltl]|uniref:Uncharacterized protein n=1 Tax=Pleurodeles waltl TaxID=8319 RepID=A0AAV7N2W0_PLEWA|nr:hypothetical protein NDU88_006242 [Pleurodeles waltl]
MEWSLGVVERGMDLRGQTEQTIPQGHSQREAGGWARTTGETNESSQKVPGSLITGTDAALRKARALGKLQYECATVSLFPNFTQQVQEARRQFLQRKRKLRDLKLEYNMLYPAQLRVIVARKPLVFTDLQKLQQFISKREAKGQRRNRQTAKEEDAPESMDEME